MLFRKLILGLEGWTAHKFFVDVVFLPNLMAGFAVAKWKDDWKWRNYALKRQVNFLRIQGDYLHFDQPSDLCYIVGSWLPNGV